MNLLNLIENAKTEWCFAHRRNLEPGLHPLHIHKTLEVIYHRLGSGFCHLAKDRTIEFKERSAFLITPDTPHAQTLNTPGLDLCLHLNLPESLMDEMPEPCLIELSADLYVDQELSLLCDTAALVTAPEQIVLAQRGKALLLYLVQKIVDGRTRNRPSRASLLALAARRRIDSDANHLGGVESLARSLHISANHLRAVFQNEYGISPQQAITQGCIDIARGLLTLTGDPIKVIAKECGFTTARYFHTRFRQITGLTPGEYRLAHQTGTAMMTPLGERHSNVKIE